VKSYGFPELTHPFWAALSRLYNAPWFSRVWVIQELATSRKAIVFVGDNAIDWGSVGVTPTWY
jgi:hypothetical protein